MFPPLIRSLSNRKSHHGFSLLNRLTTPLSDYINYSTPISNQEMASFDSASNPRSLPDNFAIKGSGAANLGLNNCRLISSSHLAVCQNMAWFCTSSSHIDVNHDMKELCIDSNGITSCEKPKVKVTSDTPIEFSKVDVNMLPTVLLIGRPNVGKSALFNRLIRRREALVYNTPNDHVTRDIREGIAKLSDLRFRVLDSAGLEAEASSGSVLGRTAGMTGNVLRRSQFALFLIDARDGLQPMDLDVGKWLRKHAPGMKTIVVMNKAESLDDDLGSLAAAAGESFRLGFGEPITVSTETGQGMVELYEALRPLLEDYMLEVLNDEGNQENSPSEDEESKAPLQLAIVGRPNVGKSTLLNALLQEDRVLVGPEAGLTRDSVRAQFEYQGKNHVHGFYTAGWLQRSNQEKGPASLSIMQ